MWSKEYHIIRVCRVMYGVRRTCVESIIFFIRVGCLFSKVNLVNVFVSVGDFFTHWKNLKRWEGEGYYKTKMYGILHPKVRWKKAWDWKWAYLWYVYNISIILYYIIYPRVLKFLDPALGIRIIHLPIGVEITKINILIGRAYNAGCGYNMGRMRNSRCRSVWHFPASAGRVAGR